MSQDHMPFFFPDWEEYTLEDNTTFVLPDDMRFNKGHVVAIIFHSILMVVSGVGNISVLYILIRRTGKLRTPINCMLIHLAIADLLVTFIMMPMEIGWAITVSWRAGDFACRIAAFFRTFGLYQSSFVLVCIGIDRYYAVLKPLKFTESSRRGKIFLSLSWILAAICSLPQMYVFHVDSHPNVTIYEQCKTHNAQDSFIAPHVVGYSIIGMIIMYIIPLLIIIYCYGSILREICRRAREPNSDKFRRSTLGFLGKAKTRTLKMTITIIFAFFICWTPYYIMSCWYWIDKSSAEKVDRRIQKGLFQFACSNSSMNPIVYGVFNIRKRGKPGLKTRDSNTCMTEVRLQHLSNRRSFQNDSPRASV